MSEENYSPGRAATKKAMLALVDRFAEKDTEDGFKTRYVEDRDDNPKRRAIRAKYARWQEANSKLEDRQRILNVRLWEIQNVCAHQEEEGCPPFNGDDGKYTCKDCGRVRRVPHRDAQW